MKDEVKGIETQIALPNGTVAPAIDLKFVQKSEPWITLEVEDGTEIRVRLEVMKVFRLVGIFDPVSGEPGYWLSSKNDNRVRAPLHLRKKPTKPTNQEVA